MAELSQKVIAQGRTAEVFAWGKGRVLKLFMDWCPPFWAENEANIARAVHQSGVPSPAVLSLVTVDGRVGIIYERVQGSSMLDEFESRPWMLVRRARLLAELHAQMHARSAKGLPTLRGRLEHEIHQASALSASTKAAILEALGRLPEGDALCHGDFHPGNVLMSPNGPVIIDWPLATCGNPLADVARTSLLLKHSVIPDYMPRRRLLLMARALFHCLYLRRYLQLRPASRQQLHAWQLPMAAARLSEGIKEEREHLAAFVEVSLRRRKGSAQMRGILREPRN